MNIATFFAFASATAAGLLALGSAFRTRRMISRWAFVAGMAALAAERLCIGLGTRTVLLTDEIYWLKQAMVAKSFLPGFWLLFSLTYSRGNAREFLTRWRFALAGVFLVPVALAAVFWRNLVVLAVEPGVGQLPVLKVGVPGLGIQLALLVTAVLVLTNLERTFRASVGTMRWRIKFMLLGVGLLFVVRLYTASQVLLFRGLDLSVEGVNSGALILGAILIVRSLFRAGHFDLDVYPSHSVLQGSFTFLLAGVYLLIIGVLAQVVAYLGGDATFTLKAFIVLLALVLLAVLLQSDRVRLHLRRFVSRHFQRPLYDYRTVWRKFTEGTASRVEPADLCRSLVRLIADIFQALSVTVWVADDSRETLAFAASTSLSEAKSREIGPQGAEAGEVLAHFREHPEPVDIESAPGNWAAALRRWNPSEFPNGGDRVCLPLTGRGGILGLIVVGDRVAGASFTLQDFDMLKCIGEDAAAGLHTAQLSQKLLQTRELEAFQTMAAFFVHDLKNAASTLNLMLKNLPVHFDNPAFREDALRGVARTVAHINGLIGRLSLLRHELKIQPVPADLNAIVAGVLSGLEKTAGAAVIQELQPLPLVPLDGDQMNKVVTNLVLNATEAVASRSLLAPRQARGPELVERAGDNREKGEVRVATRPNHGGVVLTVTDNGCGMSPEFLQRSLFRPFQTTKQTGLGIGMFQSRMIVEAHGGRITVASEHGKGTTFQVFLPAAGRASEVSGQ